MWPLFSIVASTLHTASFIFGGVFLIWYSEKQRWSKNHFVLILLPVSFAYVFLWAWLQDKIYASELRRAGVDGRNSSNFEHGLHPVHHKATMKTGEGWSRLVDASWHIDNAILIIFIAFLAGTIIAKAIFWLLGW
jgi:hypothetical protein